MRVNKVNRTNVLNNQNKYNKKVVPRFTIDRNSLDLVVNPRWLEQEPNAKVRSKSYDDLKKAKIYLKKAYGIEYL